MVMQTGKSNGFISYNKLGPFSKLATSYATVSTCRRRKRHDIPSPGPEILIAPAFSAADPERRRRLGAVARVAVSAPRPGAKRCSHRADDVGDAHHPGADVV